MSSDIVSAAATDTTRSNETGNALLETENENQSCSGTILTKLQCIRMPEPDIQLPERAADGSVSNTSDLPDTRRTQEHPDTTYSSSQATNDVQSLELEKGSQSCSGSILTTLQCIKLPVPDSDTNSISSLNLENMSLASKTSSHEESINDDTFIEKQSSETTTTKKNNSVINDARPEDSASVPGIKLSEMSPTRTVSESLSNSETPAKDHENEISMVDSESDISTASNQIDSENNTGNRDTATYESDLAFNYVRRLLENDPAIDRDNLADILGRLAVMDDEFDVPELDTSTEAVNLPQLYPMGQLVYVDCDVCFEKKDINLRTCCDKPVCDDCMLSFITIQVQQAIVKIQCPTYSCEKFVHRDEIMTRLSGDIKDKFYKFLVDANKDPHIKTCPTCSTVMTVDPNLLRDPKIKKKGLCVACAECQLQWCFTCQAPWHANIKCKQFREGDKLFKRWTKEFYCGQPNARKCPKCKIFIQRSTGCDHMRCTKCNTDFCYQCGEKFLQFKFIGDHYSRFSIFGCKYRLYPDSPLRRKLIRGSIFGSKLLLTPIIAGLVVGAGAIILAGGIFILPVWAGFRIRRHLREKREKREERAYRDHWQKRRDDMKKIGDPYLENFNHMNSLGMNPYNLGGSFGKGQGRVLMVDELDMRLPHIQLDSLSLTSLDNNSSADSFADSGAPSGQRIKLSPNSLDIHASRDADTRPGIFRLEPVHETNLDQADVAPVKLEAVVTNTHSEQDRLAAGSSDSSNNGARPKVPKKKSTKSSSRVQKKSDVRSNASSSHVDEKYSGNKISDVDSCVDIPAPFPELSFSTSESASVKSKNAENSDNSDNHERLQSTKAEDSKSEMFEKHESADSTGGEDSGNAQHRDDTSLHLPYVDDFVVETDSSKRADHSPVMVHRASSKYEFWI